LSKKLGRETSASAEPSCDSEVDDNPLAKLRRNLY